MNEYERAGILGQTEGIERFGRRVIITVERLRMLEERFPEVWLCVTIGGGLVLHARDMNSACYAPLAVFKDGNWQSNGQVVSREDVARSASGAIELQHKRYIKKP